MWAKNKQSTGFTIIAGAKEQIKAVSGSDVYCRINFPTL